jgi:hypothetical protein
MKTFAFAVAVSSAVLVTFVGARPAHALGPIDLEIAAKAGYGSNDFGFGFGGRAGISFFGFYGGLSAVDYLGKSVDDVTTHTLLLGGELGFGIKISRLTIRPLLGLGEGSSRPPSRCSQVRRRKLLPRGAFISSPEGSSSSTSDSLSSAWTRAASF